MGDNLHGLLARNMQSSESVHIIILCIYAKLILLIWDSIGTLLHYEVMLKEHMHTYSTSNVWLIQVYSVYVGVRMYA